MSEQYDLSVISSVFNSGGVFAYPTEGVWGLGCDPFNAAAVAKLLDIKSRPVEKGLILITGQLHHVDQWLVHLPASMQNKAKACWPGHITLIVPDCQNIAPAIVRGEHDSIAIRVTTHPFVQWFSHNISPLLVSTSANRSGEPACTTYDEVLTTLGCVVDYIVPGETLGAKSSSKIMHLETGRYLR